MQRLAFLLLFLSGGAWAQKKSAGVQKKSAPPASSAPARAAIQALLAERDRAFGARDAAAYLAPCTLDYVHTDTLQDTIAKDRLQQSLQEQLQAAKTATQQTQIDKFQLESGAALVETYETVRLLSYSHTWLEITGTGYRRCRYRFVHVGGTWRLARTRVLEEVLNEKPRLLDPPGLSELESRVKSPEARAIVRTVFPLLDELALAEQQKDFRRFQDHLAPDFVFIRLGKEPESRESYLEKLALSHAFISGEQVRYYLVGAELQESGELQLEVEQTLRYTIKPPEGAEESHLTILNLVLTWTKAPGIWNIRRWEHFTVDGFEDGERVDFVQKRKNSPKKTSGNQ